MEKCRLLINRYGRRFIREHHQLMRIEDCRQLNEGVKVKIRGWLTSRRYDFIGRIKDAAMNSLGESSSIQVIFPKKFSVKYKNDEYTSIKSVPLESIMEIGGIYENDEIIVENLSIINVADKKLPFTRNNFLKHHNIKEEILLKNRYLQLRYDDELKRTLTFRSSFLHQLRQFLQKHQFVDIETPTLFRCTPGGAREFIVPVHQSKHFYYSLPQSPQQFKQLLMIGGIERYFQIARCYRDETYRPDRQPEFTQLDLELSYVTREELFKLIEEMLKKTLGSIGQFPTISTFPILSYSEAMEKYGTDKPDTRFDMLIQRNIPQNQLFIQLTNGEEFIENSKKISKLIKNISKEYSIDFHLSTNSKNGLRITIDCVNEKSYKFLGEVRLRIADYLDKSSQNNNSISLLRDENKLNFLWIINFPLFEIDENNSLQSVHHPFTAPQNPEHFQSLYDKWKLNKNNFYKFTQLPSQHYDLVLNGNEIGGGSIRVHDGELQEQIFRLLDSTSSSSFKLNDELSHMVTALRSGAPPHGGIAFGLDRFIAVLLKLSSIKNCLAFPKGINGKDLLSSSPSKITSEQILKYYHQ
ncbi:hypothetical protein SNEBB_010840 [Seison nebaliae]|nr:hypothetical protein SNEBB_010840 [Seison nebaliae]